MISNRVSRQSNGRDHRETSLSDVPSRHPDSKAQPSNRLYQEANNQASLKSEFGFNGFVRGADSPPPLSDTVSPERTTEKKLSNLGRKAKMAAKVRPYM